MHVRLTAVLLAGMVAFAGSGVSTSPNAAEAPLPPSVIPAIDGFDNLRPTAPPSNALAQQERVTLTTRPIPRPASRSEHVVTRADLDRTGVLVAAYRAAAKEAPESCNLPVALLAAIGQIESGSAGGRQIGSDHVVRPGIFGPLLDGGPFAAIRDSDGGSYDGDTSWDRAVGPMQFIPSTWAWAGVDGDGDGKADPQNVYDAAHSAAGYLCRYGRDLSKPEDMRAAIWSYNQSTDYVAAVLEWTSYFNGKGLEAVGSVGFQVASGGRASLLPAVRSSSPSSSSTSSATAAERTAAARTSPTATATPAPRTTTVTPKPVTTTPTGTPTTTATSTTGTSTTTTGTPSATSTTGTGTASPTVTTTTSPTSEPSTTTSPTPPNCPSPTATVTVTPTPTTTTPTPTTSTATPTTTTPTPSPTTCSATATVTATPTATASTSTTAATEGS